MKNILLIIVITAVIGVIATLMFSYVGFFSGVGAVVLMLVGFAYLLDSGALDCLMSEARGQVVDVDETDEDVIERDDGDDFVDAWNGKPSGGMVYWRMFNGNE